MSHHIRFDGTMPNRRTRLPVQLVRGGLRDRFNPFKDFSPGTVYMLGRTSLNDSQTGRVYKGIYSEENATPLAAPVAMYDFNDNGKPFQTQTNAQTIFMLKNGNILFVSPINEISANQTAMYLFDKDLNLLDEVVYTSRDTRGFFTRDREDNIYVLRVVTTSGSNRFFVIRKYSTENDQFAFVWESEQLQYTGNNQTRPSGYVHYKATAAHLIVACVEDNNASGFNHIHKVDLQTGFLLKSNVSFSSERGFYAQLCLISNNRIVLWMAIGGFYIFDIDSLEVLKHVTHASLGNSITLSEDMFVQSWLNDLIVQATPNGFRLIDLEKEEITWQNSDYNDPFSMSFDLQHRLINTRQITGTNTNSQFIISNIETGAEVQSMVLHTGTYDLQRKVRLVMIHSDWQLDYYYVSNEKTVKTLSQHFTNFSGYSTGSAPAGWTKRLADNGDWIVKEAAGATGGKVLEFSGGTTGARRAISWDALNSIAGRENARIEIRFRGVNSGSANQESDPRIMIRGAGAAGNETLYAHGYRFGTGRLSRYNSGSFVEIASDSFAVPDNTWARTIVEVKNNIHEARTWVEGEAGESRLLVINDDVEDPGWIGLFSFAYGDYQVDWIRVEILDA